MLTQSPNLTKYEKMINSKPRRFDSNKLIGVYPRKVVSMHEMEIIGVRHYSDSKYTVIMLFDEISNTSMRLSIYHIKLPRQIKHLYELIGRRVNRFAPLVQVESINGSKSIVVEWFSTKSDNGPTANIVSNVEAGQSYRSTYRVARRQKKQAFYAGQKMTLDGLVKERV